MVSFDIQVSRSKVKFKGHVRIPHLVQRITQEQDASEASNLTAR